MGASLGGGPAAGGGRRGRGRRRRGAMSEINITPFVDVMLVLLIIFMVAAPMMTSGVPVDLPQSAAKPLQTQTEPITVSIDGQGRVFIQDKETTVDDLVSTLSAIAKNGYEERIFVRGDRAADYGAIMAVMGRLNAAGFKKIGLVTLQEQRS
ncbi:protein TolR [Segnochrobactraceae bacterium EtOH-i3]